MNGFGTSDDPRINRHGSGNNGHQQPTVNRNGRPTTEIRQHSPRLRVRVWTVGAIVILSAGVIAGCGSSTTATTSSSTTSSSTASTSASATSSAKSAASSAKSTTGASTSASYPAGKEQICQARDELKSSITALTDQSLLAAGTTAIKASVDQVQTSFEAVKTAAKDDYHSQVTDLQDALQQLQTAVGSLGSGDAASNLLAVGKAVTATAAAADDLFTQLKTACGS
jgi:alanyl-tRNA synthetase